MKIGWIRATHEFPINAEPPKVEAVPAPTGRCTSAFKALMTAVWQWTGFMPTTAYLFAGRAIPSACTGSPLKQRVPSINPRRASVGLPTSADGPHPRREGFDDRRPRTMGHRDEIKPVAGQGERMRLHEQPIPQFIADDHVAADRNPLSANNGVDRVQLLAETQVPDLFEGFEIRIARPPAIAARSALPDRGSSNHSGSKEDAGDLQPARSGHSAPTDAGCKRERTRPETPRAPQSRAAAFVHNGSPRLRRPLLHRVQHPCR
jgi:hypothetical protein